MMYHGQTALWQAYARSGDRMYRDYTDEFHRHLADFKFAHAPGPTRSQGSRIGGGNSEETPIHWAGEEDRYGGGMLNGHQGFDAEGFLLQRYLTGDRWGEETIVKSGESILARFKPEVLPEIGASLDGAQPFLTGDDPDSKSAGAFGLSAAAPPKPAGLALPYPSHQAINITPVRERQWHHFAVSWKTDPERGWISEMYIDGRPSLSWARFQTGLGRFLEAEPPKLLPPPPWPIAEPAGDTITLLGQAFDSAIDELRISRTARYPRGFVALPQRKFEPDAETAAAAL